MTCICAQCLHFFSEDEGHHFEERFFCGPPENSACRWKFYKRRAALSIFRNPLLEVLHYEVCQRGDHRKWYVSIGGVDYGGFQDRDAALHEASDAADMALQNGHDATICLNDGAATVHVV